MSVQKESCFIKTKLNVLEKYNTIKLLGGKILWTTVNEKIVAD